MSCVERSGIIYTGRRMYSSVVNESLQANANFQGRKIVAVSIEYCPGQEIASVLGIVQGVTVRFPTFKQKIIGNITALLGGTNKSFSQMCNIARQEAFDKMLEEAYKLNADAVVCIRYDTTSVGADNIMKDIVTIATEVPILGENHSNEVVCYGTAVKFQ